MHIGSTATSHLRHRYILMHEEEKKEANGGRVGHQRQLHQPINRSLSS
jgi:hypothetical protein